MAISHQSPQYNLSEYHHNTSLNKQGAPCYSSVCMQGNVPKYSVVDVNDGNSMHAGCADCLLLFTNQLYWLQMLGVHICSCPWRIPLPYQDRSTAMLLQSSSPISFWFWLWCMGCDFSQIMNIIILCWKGNCQNKNYQWLIRPQITKYCHHQPFQLYDKVL